MFAGQQRVDDAELSDVHALRLLRRVREQPFRLEPLGWTQDITRLSGAGLTDNEVSWSGLADP